MALSVSSFFWLPAALRTHFELTSHTLSSFALTIFPRATVAVWPHSNWGAEEDLTAQIGGGF